MKQIFEKTFKINFPDKEHYGQKADPVILIDYLNNIAGGHSEVLGYSLKTLLTRGYSWILLNWNIKINELPESGENINFQTWISQTRRCFADREFLIQNNQNQIILQASSRWIFYNINKQRPVKMFPEFFDNRIIKPEVAFHKSILDSSILERNRFTASEILVIVQRNDIDMLNHVHNSRYIEWIINNKPEKIRNQYKLSHIQVSYKHEVKYPGKVLVKQFLITQEDNSRLLVYDKIWDKDKERLSVEIATEWESNDV